jgi:hypothetical protein
MSGTLGTVVNRVVEQRKAAARNPRVRLAELRARYRPTPANTPQPDPKHLHIPTRS